MSPRLLAAISLSVGLALLACASPASAPTPEVATPTPVAAAASPVAQAAVPTAAPAPTLPPRPTAPTAGPAARAASPPASVPSRGLRVELAQGTEARYRVREQLARLPLPSDAVGSTREVRGALVFAADGAILRAQSGFEVDMRTLRTDSGMRDRTVGNQVLQTGRFPTATFVPIEARGLAWPLPASDEVAFELVGELTVREVTRPVTWQVVARRAGDEISGLATATFKLEDFQLEIPQVMSVLSVEDTVRLELDFRARLVGG